VPAHTPARASALGGSAGQHDWRSALSGLWTRWAQPHFLKPRELHPTRQTPLPRRVDDRAAPPADTSPSPPGVARFHAGIFDGASRRRYKLFEPASRSVNHAPMLVLLHGCRQGADDFATATRMNEAAEAAGVVVLYPEQSVSANPLRCWNWYAVQDPGIPTGDAALIAAMTVALANAHHIDPHRIYVAGMSAGGAMSAVLARDYPQLFAAFGVHSGLPAGLAHDLGSAIRLMHKGPIAPISDDEFGRQDGLRRATARIVFHGDDDEMVHPSNGVAIHAAAGGSMDAMQLTKTPASQGQHGYTRHVETRTGGVTQHELWMVHGAGHTWSGGTNTPLRSAADGPDASSEMLRFFLQHRRRAEHAEGALR